LTVHGAGGSSNEPSARPQCGLRHEALPELPLNPFTPVSRWLASAFAGVARLVVVPATLWGIVSIGTLAITAAIAEGLRFPQSVAVLAFYGAGLSTCGFVLTSGKRQADEAGFWAAAALWLALFAAAVVDLADLVRGNQEAVLVWAAAVAVFLAIWAPYVWSRRAVLPHATAWTLAAVSALPGALANLLASEIGMGRAAVLLGAILSMAAGVAAYAFASRALPLSARAVVLTAGAFLLAVLWYEASTSGFVAALAIPVAGAVYLVLLLGVERADWRTLLDERGLGLIPLGACAATVFALSGDTLARVAGVGGLIALVAWWILLRRQAGREPGAQSAAARATLERIRSGAVAGAVLATTLLCGLFATGLAWDRSSAQVLAWLRDAGVPDVDEVDVAGALLRDEYLWRDHRVELRELKKAESPLEFWTRPEFDRWSDAGQRARGRGQAQAVGTGLVVAFEGLTATVVLAPEGSPAHAVGIRRGDRILPRKEARAGDPEPWQRGVFTVDFPITMRVASRDGSERIVELTAQVLRNPRVVGTGAFEAGGRRVGYVALRGFDPVAEREFAEAVEALRAARVRTLILDLRYNPGGLVYSATGIAGAIIGERGRGRIFASTHHNSRYRDRDREIPFRVPRSGGLEPDQVVVITSGAACSASEMLVNGLRPYLPVATVGAATCGKPVGSSMFETHRWTYSVVSFTVRNARGEGEYYGGIPPTCTAPDDVTRELGDPAEASLQEALRYIETGRCSSEAARAADESGAAL
jgi:C-terminal processing protease CtpA/Prc